MSGDTLRLLVELLIFTGACVWTGQRIAKRQYGWAGLNVATAILALAYILGSQDVFVLVVRR